MKLADKLRSSRWEFITHFVQPMHVCLFLTFHLRNQIIHFLLLFLQVSVSLLFLKKPPGLGSETSKKNIDQRSVWWNHKILFC